MSARTREPRALAVAVLVGLAIALPLTMTSSVPTDRQGAADALPGTGYRMFHGLPISESAAVALSNPSDRTPKVTARSRLLQSVADVAAGQAAVVLVFAAFAFAAFGRAPSIQCAVQPSAPRAPPFPRFA